MNNQILEEELTLKTYKLENLEDHITNFVKIQYKDTTKNNYQQALTKFYNYLKDKISLVIDIFDKDKYPDNYYTQKNLLEAKKIDPV